MAKDITADDIKLALSRKYKDGWIFLTEIEQPHRYICEAWRYDFPENKTINIDEWITISRMPLDKRPKSRKLDAYAVALWASRKASAIGFEIKVNRRDFLNEVNGSKKYQAWLPYCDKFFFVCTEGLVTVNEIPDECGLATVRCWGGGYQIKYIKPAPRREIERPPWRLVARIIYKLNQENFRLKRKIFQLDQMEKNHD